jgi:hypothetical protein
MLETAPATRARRFDGASTADVLPADLGADWEPMPLARAIRSERRFRWTVLITALLTAASAYAAVVYGLQFLEDHTLQRAAVYRMVATDAVAALDAAETAAAAITDAGAPPSAVTAAVGPMLRLENVAARLGEAASTWLLEIPDPVPTPRIDDLRASRERLRRLSTSIETMTARLRLVADYRLGAAAILELPDLPSPDDPISASVAQDALGIMLADAITALGDLPDDPALAAHRDSVADLLAWIGEWQGRYIGVLQAGDLAGAIALERLARQRIDLVRLGLLDPLAEVDRWAVGLLASMQQTAAEAHLLAAP